MSQNQNNQQTQERNIQIPRKKIINDLKRQQQKKIRKELFSTLAIIISALLITFWMQYSYFMTSTVEGISMAPTLQSKDKLIISKLSVMSRSDIVIFPAPNQSDKLYIKRIIGLPGDAIIYQNDTLYINGLPYEEPYLKEAKMSLSDGELLTPEFSLFDLFGINTVPEGMYFVLGDNRKHSEDSRVFGFIKQNKVIGEAKLRYWPFGDFYYFDG